MPKNAATLKLMRPVNPHWAFRPKDNSAYIPAKPTI
jgi:hypothetical protein